MAAEDEGAEEEDRVDEGFGFGADTACFGRGDEVVEYGCVLWEDLQGWNGCGDIEEGGGGCHSREEAEGASVGEGDVGGGRGEVVSTVATFGLCVRYYFKEMFGRELEISSEGLIRQSLIPVLSQGYLRQSAP